MYLNCHSYHSLRYGTISVEDLVRDSARLGISALALTDINTITGIYEFYKLCKEFGIKPIVGVDVRLDNQQYFIALAKNNQGITEICRMLTAHNCDGEILPRQNPDLPNCFIIYPLKNIPEVLEDNEFIGIRAKELHILIQKKWQQFSEKIVVLQPVTFRTKREYNLHRILRAVDRNTLLSKLNEDDVCRTSETLKPPAEVLNDFKDHPEIVINTKKIIDECGFEFEFGVPRNKKHFTDSKDHDEKLLRKLAYQGLKFRYPENDEVARKRVEK